MHCCKVWCVKDNSQLRVMNKMSDDKLSAMSQYEHKNKVE